jgi:NitT/TauT family transport system substrate-binding protein
MIAKKPDLAGRLVQATMRGVQYANDHPDEAAEMLVRFFPDMKLKAAQIGVKAAAELLWTPEAKEYGLGYVTDEGVRHVRDSIIKYTNDTTLPALETKDAFDMSFLELKKKP